MDMQPFLELNAVITDLQSRNEEIEVEIADLQAEKVRNEAAIRLTAEEMGVTITP